MTTPGVGLAGHRLHRLADEEAEQGFLAILILLNLVSVGGEDFVDLRVDRAGVAGLLEPALLDDLAGASPVSSMISNTCLARLPDSVLSATKASNSAALAGLTGLSARVLPSRFRAPNSSDATQLAACTGGAPASSKASNQRAVSTSAVRMLAL